MTHTSNRKIIILQDCLLS